MSAPTLESINADIRKYQALTEGIGDTKILETSNKDKSKIVSDKLFFEEDCVYLYLTFNVNIKKVKCILYVTEINPDFVETMISRVGLLCTEENIENYSRDPTLIEKFWNDEFVKKYNELFKSLRRSKIKYLFKEKLKPAFSKNQFNEIVDTCG
ncbi:hypothetical protein [Candidatus Lokiarchaeum ossiferum]